MTAVLEAQPQIEVEVELSTAELSERLDVAVHQLRRWVDDGVLSAAGNALARESGPNGYRWTPPQQAAARAVTAAWRQGYDRRRLWRVGHAVTTCYRYAEPCRCEWPDLIIVINPRTAADLEPLDRHTLVVQL